MRTCLPASIAVMIIALASCSVKGAFTQPEKDLIRNSGDVMRVLSIFNPDDSLILRTPSEMLDDKAIKSEEYRLLAEKMLTTVQSPEQDGVGIAAPQVGINRRIVAVWRGDKEGGPFEVYPNVRIDSLFGEVRPGREGCLSVPGWRGIVPRYSSVIVSFTDPATLQTVRDTVHGYSAIIFQHECDHLDGIIYTDRADSLSTLK